MTKVIFSKFQWWKCRIPQSWVIKNDFLPISKPKSKISSSCFRNFGQSPYNWGKIVFWIFTYVLWICNDIYLIIFGSWKSCHFCLCDLFLSFFLWLFVFWFIFLCDQDLLTERLFLSFLLLCNEKKNSLVIYLGEEGEQALWRGWGERAGWQIWPTFGFLVFSFEWFVFFYIKKNYTCGIFIINLVGSKSVMHVTN